MIPRYTRPEMSALWTDERRYNLWLEIELAAHEALEATPNSPIPQGATAKLRESVTESQKVYDCLCHGAKSRIDMYERETQHEFVAFLRTCEERYVCPFLHYGLTSSDVQDTAFSLLLRDATALILTGVRVELFPALRAQAEAHRNTVCIGRTHGQHAEPTSLGLLFLGAYEEIKRAQVRVWDAFNQLTGKLSGAVGVYGAGFPPETEAAALKALGLKPELVGTQIVPRDRHAALFQALALLAAAIERLCLNIRHLSRSEVGELAEGFAEGQKGSSAMPHKRNPISAENLCGLARLVRGYADTSLENVALWHERDISHSSVERVIAPDITALCDYMVHRCAKLVRGLIVNVERCKHNLEMGDWRWASERVMLALVRSGLTRSVAHELVQRTTELRGFTFKRHCVYGEIYDRLGDHLLKCFDLTDVLRHIPAIYERVFGCAIENSATQ